LTRQVRSILNVMKALVAEDFTQKVNVDVQGEMLELKEFVNGMATLYGMFSSTITGEMEEMEEIEKIEKIEMEEV
jgi:osomolarity two-component system sensor histidine kinase NIK1